MKKYISIALVLIFILAFTACGSDKKISLPEPDDITEIEIMKSTSSSGVKITEQDDISIIINDIKENTKNTGKESVNDQPTNIGDYFIVKIYHENVKDSPSIVYLYEDKDKVYVEQPYSGIWKLKNDCYDNIISFILSERDDSYKPLIKLNDKIFGWVRDLGEVKLGDMEFLGEIKSSKESLSKGLNRGDENFSSNIYPTGTKIYKWDEKSILVESNNTFSICEVVE